jgi:hypothetical protein
MRDRRDLDSAERALYRAAQAELPKAASKERTLEVLRQALCEREKRDGEDRPPGQKREHPVRRLRTLRELSGTRGVWVGAGLAAAAGLALLVAQTGRVTPPSIVADPARVGVREPERPSSLEQKTSSRPREPHAPASANGPRVAPRPPSLGSEVELLERARALLAHDDPAQALRALDEYTQTLRDVALRDEATLLRIDALARSGQRSAAEQLARRFVDEHPDSPLADRARKLTGLGDASSNEQSTGGGEP